MKKKLATRKYNYLLRGWLAWGSGRETGNGERERARAKFDWRRRGGEGGPGAEGGSGWTGVGRGGGKAEEM